MFLDAENTKIANWKILSTFVLRKWKRKFWMNIYMTYATTNILLFTCLHI